MPKKAKQGRVQQGAYGFRFLLTLTLPGIMGNAAALGCRTTSDFAAPCTTLPYLEKKREDDAFLRQFNEKPSSIPSCPGQRCHFHPYMHSTGVLPWAQNDGVVKTSGMTDKYDIPVGDADLAVSKPATATQR